jgi:hypothetical protein
MDILNAETISSRLFNCDLLLAILREEPKPVSFKLFFINVFIIKTRKKFKKFI